MSLSLSLTKEKPVVAVTMANGLQGRSVIRHLSKSGKFHIRALTRNPFSSKSKDLLNYPNVEIVGADLLNIESLEKAFQGVHGIFGNTTPTKGWRVFRGSMVREYEMAQGRNLINSVKNAYISGKLKHFVFSSVCKSSDPLLSTPAPGHFSSKWDIEECISHNDLQSITTVIRPASYFENFFSNIPGARISETSFPGVVHPERKWQTIAVDDVGAWTNAILNHPDKFLGEAINLAGEEMTGNQMAELFQSLKTSQSKKVKYEMLPRFLLRLIEHDIAIMASWIERSGYGANISYLKSLSNELDFSMTSLSSWLRQKRFV